MVRTLNHWYDNVLGGFSTVWHGGQVDDRSIGVLRGGYASQRRVPSRNDLAHGSIRDATCVLSCPNIHHQSRIVPSDGLLRRVLRGHHEDRNGVLEGEDADA